ncbi:hypothetical protein EGW08_003470 [Elysia chlorotica]|uniref:Neurotransmitter-gated ion-channel transmembrane domain-containing protein n=1 Tax=Elysia chlorotica TaxID=188477 RepID=A0A433U4L1_ELYCH|nr:hypothetical protein EGW08_003470 [Elysia chlorotica]
MGVSTSVPSIEYLPRLWIPDLFFTQGLDSYRHESTTPNLFIRLWANGSVLYSQRITSTMKCQMDLSNFPHDIQHCKSPMMSYSYTTSDLIFQWSSKRQATSVLPSAYLAEFFLSKVEVSDCTETFATGTFTCLESILTLERQVGFYLTQTYIPSILIVMLSWAAFWIDHEAVPARISVGLLTVLTITTQSSGARSELPRVSYIKAIDVWMSANLIFVFTAYMEYAVVTISSRKYKRNLRNSGDPDASRRESDGDLHLSSTSIDLPQDSHVSLHSPQDVTVAFPTGKEDTSPQTIDETPELITSNGNKQIHPQDQQQIHQQQEQHPQQQHQQQQQQRVKRRTSRVQGVGQASTEGSFTNFGFIGDILSGENVKKQNRTRQFLATLKRKKRAKKIYMRNYGRRVDFHSRYLFPGAYVVFNVLYWSYYLIHS